MKILRLNKQKHNEPRFDELSRMLCDLKGFFNEDVNPNDEQWNENLSAILDFQDKDGSFNLFDSYEIPSDARVDFCYLPTYICSAILMKAFMTDCDAFTLKERSALMNGLRMCCARSLRGHGYDAFKGQIETLKLFMKAGLNEFIDLHADICPEFSGMINKIVTEFKDMEAQGKFIGPWGESYEDEIRAVNEYFSQRKVFVYGTLMRGEANEHYLEDSICLGPATIEGYDMYNVGWFPAIVPGDSLIVGELYQVPLRDIPAIDMLEGEGSLYTKRCETVTVGGKTTFALVYVYNGDCLGLEGIPAWKNDYVWYVSYGSNMFMERFLHYIHGGSFGGCRDLPACKDTTPPIAVKTIEIPYGMYFGQYSPYWEGGVSFLDVTDKKGKALGIAYLVSKDQFRHIVTQENGGHYPKDGRGWYPNIIGLGIIGGFEVKTVTKNIRHEYNEPSQKYLDTLRNGIRENWPDMSDEDIEDYLNGCIR